MLASNELEAPIVIRKLLGAALLAFAFSSGQAPSAMQAKPRTIEIKSADDMKWSVTTIKAKRGEQLRVRLTA